MRFLCLHGAGTNANIFKYQAWPVLHTIGEEDDFEFFEGEYESPPAAGIGELFPGPYKSWSMGPETYNSALSSVQEIIATEGPFDACIGFSQGAVLLSTLIISHQREHPFEQDLFKMAVFFSGSSPFEVDDYGQWIPIDPATMKNGKIRIPTTHIYGIKDDIAKECSKLAGCCEPSVQAIFKHDLGHEIPRRPISVVEKMVKAVEKSVRNARFGM